MRSDTTITDCRKLPREERKKCRIEMLAITRTNWLRRLTYGPNRNHAQLVNLWMSIFAVNIRTITNPHWILDQIKSIETWQFNNYQNLLYSQILNPALLQYMNAFKNRKNNPNENLGRELLELYTLGEGNFSESDVINTSLALTGLKLDERNKVIRSKKFHDTRRKTILGKNDVFELNSLVNWLGDQSSTAENITKRFCNYAIGAEFNKEELFEIIKDFRESNLNLPSLYKSISQNIKYKECKKLGLRLLDPITLVSNSIALIGSNHPNNYSIGIKILNLMGQPFLEPPNPKGWPYGEGWLSSSRIMSRKKGLMLLLADEEIWDTRNPPKLLTTDLLTIKPINIKLPADSSRENIALLFSDPSWSFSGPLDLTF